jgi:hypothetical protein
LFSCEVLSSHLVSNWSTTISWGFPLWFSCKVLSSHLVKNWSTKKSKGFLFD